MLYLQEKLKLALCKSRLSVETSTKSLALAYPLLSTKMNGLLSTFKSTHWRCCPGYQLGQNLEKSSLMMDSVTRRTRISLGRAACGI